MFFLYTSIPGCFYEIFVKIFTGNQIYWYARYNIGNPSGAVFIDRIPRLTLSATTMSPPGATTRAEMSEMLGWLRQVGQAASANSVSVSPP